MELYIIRHGQTDYNKAGIIQGRKINAPLNELGRKQALSFYTFYKETQFNHVITSSLLRTQQTVNPFTVNGYQYKAFTEIDEIDWGNQEGLQSNPELKTRYKKLLSEWKSGKLGNSMPGGESALDVEDRMKKFNREILNHLNGKVLICSHGRAMRVMLCNLLNIPLTEMDKFPHENLSLYKLSRENGKYKIDWKNNIRHLKNLKV